MEGDEVKLIPVAEDSPLRCRNGSKFGQCIYQVVPGAEMCPRHVGTGTGSQRQAVLRNYVLTKFRAQIAEKAYAPTLKSLQEEIAVLRFALERVLESCNDDFDVVLYQGKITELVKAITSTVEACHKMEEKAGLVLDRGQLMVISSRLITILNQEIDPERLPMVADQIVQAFNDPVE